ncbi:uncharacterized protein LOC105198350 [Solenopsis invicta]|uniref:uncharacterized protein LOC105198350 n=1 Tax=Solenopsis invicta TaxID=13686 RepID=UPI00193E2359|nr:uncharacterized protein LOC105198350 [Solenopsis invicta]
MIKYIAFVINTNNMKDLLIQLQHICNELKDESENAIIKKYGQNAKRYTVALIILGTGSLFILIIVQFWTNIVDIVLPKNESRSRHVLIMTEYFIDQEKYFYLIVLHVHTAIWIGAFIIVSTGSMLIAYIQYMCGLFRISSYRFERAMGFNMLRNITCKNENLIFKGVICAVDIHRQAMRLSELIVCKFETMLFCLITVGVTCLSLNLFRMFQVASSGENIKEILLPFIFSVCSVLYMFIANYIGQDIINYNNRIYIAAYNVQWYMAPLHVQKLILFVLQRSAKEFSLGVGGLFIGSLECFATLVKASVSYFTFIYSAQ